MKLKNETKIGITIALTTIVELALATIALSNALAITPKLARADKMEKLTEYTHNFNLIFDLIKCML
jgi:hypothetical protein